MRLIVIASAACLLAAPAAQSAAPAEPSPTVGSGTTQPANPAPEASQTKPDVKNYGYCLDGTKHIPGIPCKDGTKFNVRTTGPAGSTKEPPAPAPSN